MRCTHLAAALLLALLPAAVAAQKPEPKAKAAPTPGVSVAFEREQAINNAVKAGDIAAFNRLSGGTFTYVDANGIVAWTPKMSDMIKDCTTASIETSEVKTQQPEPDIVILSYKATVDQTCKGVKSPSPVLILSVWQRGPTAWRMIAHSETPPAK